MWQCKHFSPPTHQTLCETEVRHQVALPGGPAPPAPPTSRQRRQHEDPQAPDAAVILGLCTGQQGGHILSLQSICRNASLRTCFALSDKKLNQPLSSKSSPFQPRASQNGLSLGCAWTVLLEEPEGHLQDQTCLSHQIAICKHSSQYSQGAPSEQRGACGLQQQHHCTPRNHM